MTAPGPKERALAHRAIAAVGVVTPVSRSRRRWALGVAALVDALQLGLFPAFVGGAAEPPDLVADSVAAVVLLLILGFKWRLVMGFVAELVPGLDLFPTWTAVVLSIPVETEAPKALPETTP